MSIFWLLPAAWLLLYAPGRYLARWLGSAPSPPLAAVLLSTSLASFLGLVLAEAGIFSTLTLLVVLGGITLLAATKREQEPRAYGTTGIIGWVVLGVSFLWLTPPLDTSMLAADSPGYLASGTFLARNGSLVVHDPTMAHLDIDTKRILFPSVAADWGSPPYLRLLGSMVLRSLDTDEVLPAFHHLLTVWVALGNDLLGSGHAEWILTLFGSLSMWTIYSCVGATLGGTSAVAIWIALLLSAPQYWYSRFLMPEVPGQFFVWGGLWALTQEEHLGKRSAAVVAGVAFGIAGIMRLENALFVAAALLASAWAMPASEWRSRRWMVGVFLLLSAHLAWHSTVFRTHYFGNVQTFFRDVAGGGVWPWAAGLLIGAIAMTFRRIVTKPQIRTSVAFLILLLIGLSTDARHGFETIRLLVTFCGPLTVFVGLVGIVLLVSGSPDLSFFGTVSSMLIAVVLAQMLIQTHAAPVPIWAIRRTVPVLLPALYIGCLAICRRFGRLWLIPFGVCVAAGLPTFFTLWSEPLYRGGRYHVAALSTLIPTRSCVFMDATLTGIGLAPMVWSEREAPVYLLAANDAVVNDLRSKLSDFPVYWLGRGDRPPPSGDSFIVRPVARYDFDYTTPKLEEGASPQMVTTMQSSLALYE
ncbi:MAG: hypothetical protein HY270_00715, partial [Deltaproteobacteria bacterium]|nr:hypothetical protein [Deltaproteobacteria bacterium]